MQITSFDGDLCTGWSHDPAIGVPAPENFGPDDLEKLRFDGMSVVDVRDRTSWAIDEFGRKRLPETADPEWQLFQCNVEEEIIAGDDGWRVKTDDDRKQEIIDSAKRTVRNEIDALSGQLTRNYTGTEEKGWIAMLAQAEAFTASGNDADAPGLALDAAIRGDTVANRAAAVLAAAQVTGLIPSLASGMRARAETLIDATDGDPSQIDQVFTMLKAKGGAILAAAHAGDRNQIIAMATTGWDG